MIGLLTTNKSNIHSPTLQQIHPHSTSANTSTSFCNDPSVTKKTITRDRNGDRDVNGDNEIEMMKISEDVLENDEKTKIDESLRADCPPDHIGRDLRTTTRVYASRENCRSGEHVEDVKGPTMSEYNAQGAFVTNSSANESEEKYQIFNLCVKDMAPGMSFSEQGEVLASSASSLSDDHSGLNASKIEIAEWSAIEKEYEIDQPESVDQVQFVYDTESCDDILRMLGSPTHLPTKYEVEAMQNELLAPGVHPEGPGAVCVDQQSQFLNNAIAYSNSTHDQPSTTSHSDAQNVVPHETQLYPAIRAQLAVHNEEIFNSAASSNKGKIIDDELLANSAGGLEYRNEAIASWTKTESFGNYDDDVGMAEHIVKKSPVRKVGILAQVKTRSRKKTKLREQQNRQLHAVCGVRNEADKSWGAIKKLKHIKGEWWVKIEDGKVVSNRCGRCQGDRPSEGYIKGKRHMLEPLVKAPFPKCDECYKDEFTSIEEAENCKWCVRRYYLDRDKVLQGHRLQVNEDEMTEELAAFKAKTTVEKTSS
ncbi:hypothetical protein QAD02_020363 [Eretmocerus hayati]|uniref:Uncharacterized protein n=1 Tax=Eretmocerus hayati TaxID=131215 RepID=A0ACC2PNH3_9HYME|nr:hypothetical protein QAD02_020363 [Eretmocerus hayati]